MRGRIEKKRGYAEVSETHIDTMEDASAVPVVDLVEDPDLAMGDDDARAEDEGGSGARTPTPKRARASGEAVEEELTPPKTSVKQYSADMDLKDIMLANFPMAHSKNDEFAAILGKHESLMRGLGEEVKNQQRELNTVKSAVTSLEKRVKDNEKKLVANVQKT